MQYWKEMSVIPRRTEAEAGLSGEPSVPFDDLPPSRPCRHVACTPVHLSQLPGHSIRKASRAEKVAHALTASSCPILIVSPPLAPAAASAINCASIHRSMAPNKYVAASTLFPTVKMPWFCKMTALFFPSALAMFRPSS